MTNLHRLPEPVPEGWYVEQTDAQPSYRRVGTWDMRVILFADGYDAMAFMDPAIHGVGMVAVRRLKSLAEACAAAERAFCGCYVGAVLPRKG